MSPILFQGRGAGRGGGRGEGAVEEKGVSRLIFFSLFLFFGGGRFMLKSRRFVSNANTKLAFKTFWDLRGTSWLRLRYQPLEATRATIEVRACFFFSEVSSIRVVRPLPKK